MGLSRLSEKCQNCKQKDTCNNKRMEACAYIDNQYATGGLVSGAQLMACGNAEPCLIGSFSNSGLSMLLNTEPMLDALAKAVRKSLECAFNRSGVNINV
jgi:hypothetical protein